MSTSEDAVTRGELQFAIVESFNSRSTPSKGRINPKGLAYFGDGSGDMTGTVRLMDGTSLPFAYTDGRFPVHNDILWDEHGYSPAWGGSGMSWPYESAVLMVEVHENRVRRWTWPSVIMGSAYSVNDHRYLEPPRYGADAKLRGLHCLVDKQLLPQEDAAELAKEWSQPICGFPPYAVYVGHYADGYLPFAQTPERYAVFKWDAKLGKSYRVAG